MTSGRKTVTHHPTCVRAHACISVDRWGALEERGMQWVDPAGDDERQRYGSEGWVALGCCCVAGLIKGGGG